MKPERRGRSFSGTKFKASEVANPNQSPPGTRAWWKGASGRWGADTEGCSGEEHRVLTTQGRSS